jgi:DNA-damage-inducible protein J
MAESRLSVRVDAAIKEQAEDIFKRLGLTTSAAVNTFLNRVVMQQGIPFALTLDAPSTKVRAAERAARHAVQGQIDRSESLGAPVALYDAGERRPYLAYPDGRREYQL